jgi:hypothetical protein
MFCVKFALQGWAKINCLNEGKGVRKCRHSATLWQVSLVIDSEFLISKCFILRQGLKRVGET